MHTIISIIFFIVLLQWIVLQQLLPFFQQLATLIEHFPYSKQLLYTALLLLFAEQLHELLDQFEYEAIAQLMLLSTRLVVTTYWLFEAQLPIQNIVSLLQSFL